MSGAIKLPKAFLKRMQQRTAAAQERKAQGAQALQAEGVFTAEATPVLSQVEVLPPIEEPTPVHFLDNLDAFREECSTRFPEFKQRLTFHIHGKDDTQQWIAATRIAYERGHLRRNIQIIAPTGQGKTYVCACVLRLLSEFWPDEYDDLRALTQGRVPKIVIQPLKNIVPTRQVLASFGLPLTIVCSLASLRATLGESLIEFRTIIVNQSSQIYPFWHKDRATPLLWVDESQQLKNESVQSDIIVSGSLSGIPTIVASASPYSRPCQARAIAIILAPEISKNVFLSPKVWPSFVETCCPAKVSPKDWSPAAMRRVQSYLEPQTVRWSIDYPFPVRTRMVECRFENEASRARYQDAFDAWQEKRMKAERNPLEGMAALLVAIAKFNQVAEEERVPQKIKLALRLWTEGLKREKPINLILAFAYRTSANLASAYLLRALGEKDYRRLVAHVVGGIDSAADIAAFQADRKNFLILTIACGGAGLSLDHTDGNNNPRVMLCSSVWNDIQMIQLAGRTQRLKTKSVSFMYVLYFAGTEEVKKVQKMKRKVRSLKEVTTGISARDHNEEGSSGTFIADIDELRSAKGSNNNHLLELVAPPPTSEEDEDAALEGVVGTTTKIELELDEDETID